MATDKSIMALIKALKPTFRDGNANDRVAFAVHAFFSASGYILTATGPRAFSQSAMTSSSTDETEIEQWNELDDQYAFVYVNPEMGSAKVLVKCLVMEGKLHVYCALADGSSKHVELIVGDYYVEENGSGNYSRQLKNLGMLVTILEESLRPLSSETSKTQCVRRIEIEQGSGPGPHCQISGRKRKELHTVCEENTNPANMAPGCGKVDRLKEENVPVKHVHSTRRMKQKKGSASDEPVGLGILIEDVKLDNKEPHDVPFTAPNPTSTKAQPTPASNAGCSAPATQLCSLSSDQILPTPIKKMSPHRLQDGEVYQGRRLRRYQRK